MILQNRMPHDPFASPRLPGVARLQMADWLHVDEAYAAQMSERKRLLQERRADVLWQARGAQDAARETLELVLAHLPAGFERDGQDLLRPDGVRVRLDPAQPLETCANVIQEDLCVMIKRGPQHVLAAGLLCFPASWRLAEKAGRPLVEIHAPVDDYDDGLARRVQRLFDGVQAGRPLWRFNALWYDDPALFQPRSASCPRPATTPGKAPYFRSERQGILRLPRSNAVLFSIHTYVLARRDALALSDRP